MLKRLPINLDGIRAMLTPARRVAELEELVHLLRTELAYERLMRQQAEERLGLRRPGEISQAVPMP